ncbi:MAG TPA: ATP-binding protein [Anaerolineaceae bacterium]
MQNSISHPPPDLSIQHLQAELARIDACIRRQVQRWRSAGQDQNDAFRGLHVTDSEVDGLLNRPFGSNWGDMAALTPEETSNFDAREKHAIVRSQQIQAQASKEGRALRLALLAEAFELSRFEVDVLLISLAPTLDLRYERIYAYLQDDITRKLPTVNLVFDLLQKPGVERLGWLAAFGADAPLFKYRLLEHHSDPQEGRQPLLSQALLVDETIIAWLLGTYQPHPNLKAWSSLVFPTDSQEDRLLTHSIWNELAPVLPEQPILIFFGQDTASQEAAARRAAFHAGRPLLTVDLTGALAGSSAEGLSPLDAVRLVLRDCRLTGAIPFLNGWDACLNEAGFPAPGLLAELCDFPGTVITAGRTLWQAQGSGRERPLSWQDFPLPAYPQRLALWQHYLNGGEQDNLGLMDLAGQFALTSAQIRDAVRSGQDIAFRQKRPIEKADLFFAARAHSNPRLAALAHKITPRYNWTDIVLPPDPRAILAEIVAAVRGRPQVLEGWGLGKKLVASSGLTVLFAGEPGTGKTMAAEVIANELGMDLYKIDLSTVVSKYIGETEKNLDQIFNEAQSSNAILFFDEADAIFGKRSEVKDAHDRYANIEVSYLLQRMEAYDGITILATNLRANLDEAFLRRLQFVVDFPFPDEAERLHIWQTLFPPEVPKAPDVEFEALARRYKIAGGNIRNIIVSAVYLAASEQQPVQMRHLLHGARREMQKIGKLVRD